VLDVARPGGAIDTEQRSFGTSPGRVIRAGVGGFAAGLQRGGVAATAKHFPGIGMIATNTDFASQKVRTSKRELRRRDEPPFEAFSESGGELVMLSLATYTAFSDRPAAFSRSIVTGELRRRLGFEGVSITDGLGAAAAQAFGSDGEIALAATGAGVDLLLYTDWREGRSAHRLLRERLQKGKLNRDEFEESAGRVLALREAP
jgi:beta-N-acetylhexosaminidase